MLTDKDTRFDPNEPALIVVAGRTRKKRRPIDAEVFVLGRAPGCNLGLVSAEVAPVHCVIARTKSGWVVRDCTGRGATQVNGAAIRESVLRDGDILQVGSFSFEAYLPKTTVFHSVPEGAPVARSAEGPTEGNRALVKKLQRSRRNLAHHALQLRARLRANTEGEADLEQRRDDLERQEERLRNRAREQEARSSRLEQEKQQLEQLRADLDRKRGELILAGHAEDAADMEEQVRELEQWGVSLVRQSRTLDNRAVELDRREAELRAFARHLVRLRRRLAAAAPTVAKEDPPSRVKQQRPETTQVPRMPVFEVGSSVYSTDALGVG